MNSTIFEVTLLKDGKASAATPLVFGYIGNRGVYKLKITTVDELGECTVRIFWHTADCTGPITSLVVDGEVTVPAAVTAVSGAGRVVFECVANDKVVTTSDLRYVVKANSGTQSKSDPETGSTSWQDFVSMVADDAKAADQAAKEAEAWAHGSGEYPAMDEDNAKYYAGLAEQAASRAGYLTFGIAEDGYLYMKKQNAEDLTFYLNEEGELEVEYGY